MRNPEDRAIALECLKLAVENRCNADPVPDAREFFAFVMGETDAHDTLDLIKRLISDSRQSDED